MTYNLHSQEEKVALVVDDDPAQRMLLQTVIEHSGIKVKEAENGLDALTIFKTEPVDIVLMDIKMPIMNGIDACKAIRSLAAGADVPIVLITGSDDRESIKVAFDAGATDFIVKPVNWPILAHRVQYLLKTALVFRQLRSSEQRLGQAQKTAALGAWELDFRTDEYFISEQVGQMLEIPSDIKNATGSQFREKVHPEDKAELNKVIERSKAELTPYSIDYRVILAGNLECVFHEQGELIYSSEGEPLRFIGTIQDIPNSSAKPASM